jgi:two-component system, OmpR family, response regulator
MRILVVEDEAEMAGLIVSLIESAGYVVDKSGSLEDARQSARQADYDLIVLDRRLPDGDGISVVSTLRMLQPGVRILMLSALNSLSETVSGLDGGADDYLTKPFQGPELIARIRASLRRPGREASALLKIGNLSFDPVSREVAVSGAPVYLHRRELTLLEALMRRAKRVVPRETLLDEIYGLHSEVRQHTLDTLVWRLRRQLQVFESSVTIHLARGLGYMIVETSHDR